MLQNLKQLYGHNLAAIDGDIGHVKDFYFDDKTWVVRYLVADTGTWLTGRLVLISPHAFGSLDEPGKTLHIKLHKARIESSPSIETHRPVSRQYEVDYYRFYGWPAYWEGDAMWGLGAYPAIMPPTVAEMAADRKHHHRDDKHLQSTHAVTGYHIQTAEGPIGHVSGFLVDDRSWEICELVVETGHWYAGKRIMISPAKVERISYEESKVFVKLTKAEIEHTAASHLARVEPVGT